MKWAVELKGHNFDLQKAKELFASGSLRVETIGNSELVLVSDDFESLSNSVQVLEKAKEKLGLINGVLFLHDTARKPLHAGHVRENKNGNWATHHVMVVETMELRTKFNAPTVLVNGKPGPTEQASEQKWLEDAATNDAVADVLSHLSDAKPEWPELYKAYERMRGDINKKLGQQKQESMGWPTKAELDFFTKTTNAYRHSPPKWEGLAPETAMKIDDARTFIKRLARTWLDWRASNNVS